MSSEPKIEIYIFDYDGTLSDPTHRRHLVGKGPNKNFNKFLKECVNDTPIRANLSLFVNLSLLEYTETFILSGREYSVFDQSVDWLMKHCNFAPAYRDELATRLFMRSEKDYRPDEVVKPELYEMLIDHLNWRYGVDRWEIMGVFDDRPKVVRKWQEMGIYTWDVGQGCEEF